MRFFRRQSSPVMVALLAVAMQAAVLMAHAHVHPQPSGRHTLHVLAKTDVLACRAMVRPAHCAPAIPDGHDDCPLCWLLLASGAGVLPAPIALSAEVLPAPVLRAPAVATLAGDGASVQFQARAPPSRPIG
ncbi:DUF2946 domain-containing protein [Hyphomicrobium sp. 1Nfss2.1]|uniref:hypothetical protein n=1 Tax=Hyphomicrobium sp. 1Nfss2.1 TaxID=3413936 RepID=UPI003C7AE3B0